MDGLKRAGKATSAHGPRRRDVLKLSPRWAWLVAALILVGLAIPIIAAGYISTGPSHDKSWYWQNPVPQGNDLRSASWIDHQTGWAVGLSGVILKSIDGGITWEDLNSGTFRDLTGVAFVDANRGWAVGLAGTLRTTSDGGSTWATQTVPAAQATRSLRAVSFYDANTGVAVGDRGTTTATIVYTSNDGSAWRTAATTSTVSLTSVEMVSATEGWAVGGAGEFLKTVDGGATWNRQPSPTGLGLNSISFAPDGLNGFAVGTVSAPNWTIFKTTDGGGNWTAVSGLGAIGAQTLYAVSCLDATNTVAVGGTGSIRRTTDGGLTWQNQSQPLLGTTPLRAVSLLDAATGRAVGDYGSMIVTNDGGSFWASQAPGTAANLYATSFIDSDNGYAVGTGGTVLKTPDAGQSWETISSGAAVLRGVQFLDLNTGWVVGDGGLIRKTLDGGASWAQQSSPTTATLNSVWFTDANNGCAAGAGGTILQTSNGGATWETRTSLTANALNGVWFANATDGWAVGAVGTIRKTNDGGATWTAVTSNTTRALYAVRGVSSTAVWAVGSLGTLVRTTDGTAWTNLTASTGTTVALYCVSFADANTGWVGGASGTLRTTTNGGSGWSAQSVGLPATVSVRGLAFPTAANGFAVGDAGALRRTIDGGSSWSSIQYGTVQQINSVSFAADGLNGWAACNGGQVMRTSDGGQRWVQEKTGSTANLRALSMADASRGWTVGSAGTILRTSNGGSTWAAQSSGTALQFNSVTAVDATHAVVAGSSGAIKFTADGGSSWTTATSVPTTQTFNAVEMVSGTTGYAVSNYAATVATNTIFKTTDGGNSWVAQPNTAAASLFDLHFLSATEGYASGNGGTILKTVNGGTTWTKLNTGTGITLPFNGIAFADANHGWAVGTLGTVIRTENAGATWGVQQSGTGSRTFTGVAFVDPTTGWIVGAGGTILRTTDRTPPVTSMTVDPVAPEGANGWYLTTPVITLTPSKPGITYYNWASPAGPYTPYSTPVIALEGAQSIYYYSVDAGGITETVTVAPFKTDLTDPIMQSIATAPSVTTSTVTLEWTASSDAVSGVNDYDVYLDGVYSASSTSTGTVLTGLSPDTVYTVTIVAVDAAGRASIPSIPLLALTEPIDVSPLHTVLTIDPPIPSGSNNWYVTTPTVTMSVEPSTVAAVIYYSWESTIGPYTSYTATTTPPGASSTLYFSAHDTAAVRADEPTRQASFLIDTATPAVPSVTGVATSYSTAHLEWPAVLDTPSGIERYDVYRDGIFLASTVSPAMDITGLSQDTTYGFVVFAINTAGTSSAGSTTLELTTPATLLPSPPTVVYARSPSGDRAYVNWSAVTTDTIGAVNYRVWRSQNGSSYSAIAATTGGADGTTYTDSTLSASTRYWYAVSTIDARGESPLSATTGSEWASIATTSAGPQRPTGLIAVEASASVALSWQASPNPSTVGYQVMRADASLATPTVLTSVPTTQIGTTYFDLSVVNGQPYYYSVAAVDASGIVGSSSLELEARPRGLIEDPTPHTVGSDASSCICHTPHTATAPNKSDGSNKLIRFPNSTVDSMCSSCHPPADALGEFLDPLAKSRHDLDATTSASAPFTCLTCHRPVKNINEPSANLMRVNGTWVCMEASNSPAGDGFCYSCHGVGSTLPRGDLSGFENSAHATVTAPPTGAGIKCDTCHESHSSRNEHLTKYAGYMVCMQCHAPSAPNPSHPALLDRLTLSTDANAKHPLLPQDQTDGSAMSCQNCHNTHSVTHASPLVDPHNPKPGTWLTTDAKAYCFRCHDGQALPTSVETTPWAGPVLASGAATTVANIRLAYDRNVHGLGAESGSTTTTAYLRSDMGYSYNTVLECGSCHDPHGSANNYALRQDIASADGSKTITGLVVAPVPGGGYDLRFFCSSCHVFNSATHDVESMANTSTAGFPTDCTAASCHRHMDATGAQGSRGL